MQLSIKINFLDFLNVVQRLRQPSEWVCFWSHLGIQSSYVVSCIKAYKYVSGDALFDLWNNHVCINSWWLAFYDRALLILTIDPSFHVCGTALRFNAQKHHTHHKFHMNIDGWFAICEYRRYTQHHTVDGNNNRTSNFMIVSFYTLAWAKRALPICSYYSFSQSCQRGRRGEG